MRKLMILLGFGALAAAFIPEVGAIGRGGGGGGGGARGGGGGARSSAPVQRPSAPVQRPSAPVQRPSGSVQRPTAPVQRPSMPTHQPSIAKPSAPVNRPSIQSPIAHTPSIGNVSSRPNMPSGGKVNVPKTLPSSPVATKPNLPKTGGGNHNFNLPGNAQVGNQLPKNRPDFKPPTNLPKGNHPGPGNRPDIGKLPVGKGSNIGDLQKKNPGLFDRPKDGGVLAGKGPSRDDVSNWLGMPNDHRPNHPNTLPAQRPDRVKINNDFKKNWNTAIGDNNVNIGNKNVGNINVDMSKNLNYQNLSRHANVVQNNLRPYQGNWFNSGWWGNRPGQWPYWHYHNALHPPNYWWRPCAWGALTGFMASAAWSSPVYYDYGSNVVVQQDVVYVNEQPVSSAPVYAQQAIDLAAVQPPPPEAKIEWMPLGTFALSSNKDDDNPGTIVQLALSKDGIVSGTWYNRATDKSSDIEGRVEPETQRLALRKPDQPDVVLEVGVYNLTQAATPCMVHFGTLRSETWYMTRLETPQ